MGYAFLSRDLYRASFRDFGPDETMPAQKKSPKTAGVPEERVTLADVVRVLRGVLRAAPRSADRGPKPETEGGEPCSSRTASHS